MARAHDRGDCVAARRSEPCRYRSRHPSSRADTPIARRPVPTSHDESFRTDHAEAQVEAILDRVLRAYHRDEGHGCASWIGESLLDAELVPVARAAFLDADHMPPDHEVLQVLHGDDLHLLGE